MMSYTKGPWSISRRSKSTELKDIFISAGGEYVARVVVPYTSKSIEEYENNARLIAAAPDLLAALETLANMAQSFPSELHRDHPDVVAARAAIAKATGAS